MKHTIDNNTLTLYFEDNITAVNATHLAEELKRIVKGHHQFSQVVADMEQVAYLDSTGITILVGLYKTIKSEEKTFHMTQVRKEIRGLLALMRLDETFNVK